MNRWRQKNDESKINFCASKVGKITLLVLNIIVVVGIVGTLALNQSVRGETYSANLTLNSQISLERSDQIAYHFFIDFPKFKPLLRSKSISCVDITQFLWDNIMLETQFLRVDVCTEIERLAKMELRIKV